ncbi:MAG TPA: Hsp20/alpha crystallin family protein [Pyrinomonadaceae bacterium]|nr:Hsp20/alpha crystallin family protein [Pyrinomonadaceae bacterium]
MANAKKKATKKSPQSNSAKGQISPGRKQTNQAEGTATGLSRPEPNDLGTGSPFTFMRRFSEEMDRLFGEYGLGRGWLAPAFEGGLDRLTALGSSKFSPQIEVFERDKNLVIRADLPGMTKDNVNIEIANEAVVIRGERHSEREEDAKGYYRSERSYGSFYRRIPLPEGVSADKATADFRNGVLEISIPAGAQVEEKRRQLEIRGETEEQPRSKAKAAGQ